jgi:choline dehydrogenase-like flavoprotein
MDPIDFTTWPVHYEEMLPWYETAAVFLGVRSTHLSEAPGAFARLQSFDATRDETWGPQIDLPRRWRPRLEAANGPAVVLNARVVGAECQAGVVSALRVRIGGEERLARAQRYVLACGGLGTLRLLLLLQRDRPDLFGGPDGPLGRGYMGHLTGAIADLRLADPEDADAFACRPLEPGLFLRRQMHARASVIREHGIGHIAFWLDNASDHETARGLAVGSAKHLAARLWRNVAAPGRASEPPLVPHLANVARAPATAVMSLGRLAWRRRARATGQSPPPRLLPSYNGAWRLRYHAEQRPDPANRVRLSDRLSDSAGLPRLHIAFRYSDSDIESVVRAHELLDADLNAAGAGRLEWRGARERSAAMVREAARDGYHQLGGAAMGLDAGEGVVDAECRTFGLDNLWIASSSVFPSGGQANPTLTIVALACRVADRVAKRRAAAA